MTEGKDRLVKGRAHYPEEGRELYLELFGRHCAPAGESNSPRPQPAAPPKFDIPGPADDSAPVPPPPGDRRRPAPGVMEVMAYGRKA